MAFRVNYFNDWESQPEARVKRAQAQSHSREPRQSEI